MRPREVLSRLNRVQRSLPFKIAASVVVVALAIAVFSTYFVAVKAPVAAPAARDQAQSEPAGSAAPEGAGGATDQGSAAGQPGATGSTGPTAEEKSAIEAARRVYADLLSKRADLTNVAIGTGVVTGVALVIVWLGLALTYLGLFAATGLLVLPMWLLSRTTYAAQTAVAGTETPIAEALAGATRLILGAAFLTAAFTALLQGLRILLSGPHPVMAIAKNVVAEAVRMKISLVFIVILIFAMAALPGMLSQDTPLRYRVQAFLQYGTGGSYWIIAVLVLFFAAASVSFEQRDRQIWQTMTKPVASWQYVLGKWIGVSGLAAVLLAVCCAGVFLFTEYLRQQPAIGESVRAIDAGQQGLTEDRLILETQVLSARKTVQPAIPLSESDPDFVNGVKAYIDEHRKDDPSFATDQATFDRVVNDSWKATLAAYMSVPPGGYGVYHFNGLQEAKARNQPLILRYRIEAGSNSPDQLYKITFIIGGEIQPAQECTLGPTHTVTLLPSAINDDGRLEVQVENGEILVAPDGSAAMAPNPGTINFPTGGLEISYAASSYYMNFLRVAVVLWIKLAFLAMLAITAATFLSFPVACLVAFSVFLMAEGAGFLGNAMEYYDVLSGTQGKIVYWKVPIRAIGLGVAGMFKNYADLRPTTRLVDGQLLAWDAVAWGLLILMVWSGALFGAATLIFRRRELATYSGQ